MNVTDLKINRNKRKNRKRGQKTSWGLCQLCEYLFYRDKCPVLEWG